MEKILDDAKMWLRQAFDPKLPSPYEEQPKYKCERCKKIIAIPLHKCSDCGGKIKFMA